MIIIRLVIFAAIVLVGVFLLRQIFRSDALNGPKKPKNVERQDGADPNNTMRACAFCDVHIPESEAIQVGDHFFCCAEHRDRFQDLKFKNEDKRQNDEDQSSNDGGSP